MTYIVDNLSDFKDVYYRNMTVLGAMSSVLGCVFPTPLLGVLMIFELGKPPKQTAEHILVLSVGSIISYLVYESILKYTYLRIPSSSVELVINLVILVSSAYSIN